MNESQGQRSGGREASAVTEIVTRTGLDDISVDNHFVAASSSAPTHRACSIGCYQLFSMSLRTTQGPPAVPGLVSKLIRIFQASYTMCLPCFSAPGRSCKCDLSHGPYLVFASPASPFSTIPDPLDMADTCVLEASGPASTTRFLPFGWLQLVSDMSGERLASPATHISKDC